jgi:tetratricopeptide (TPR) repeat protein
LEAIRRASRAAPRDGRVQLAHAEIALSAASLEPAPRPLLEEAEAAARRAVGCEPERAEGYQRLGQVLAARVALGEADAAEADAAFDRASRLAPQSGLVLVERSRADLVLGRPDAARRRAERAAALYPRDALAWAALAAAAQASGDLQAALAALDRALAADWHGRALEEARARAWRVELGP